MSSGIDSNRTGALKVKILRTIVYIVMGLTVVLLFFMPRFLRNEMGFFSAVINSALSYSLMVYIILCCIPFLFALFTVKKICDLISSGDSFSVATLSQLTRIVICCFFEVGINILAVILFSVIYNIQFLSLNLLIIGICGSVAVFTTVLKELVKSAIRLREENELTI